jgi:prepilin-type N-terminal cleavage/methylation domain-containing protein
VNRNARRLGRARSERTRRAARGFTLIELLIAAALLAVLAVLSWRGLDAVLESRRRIVAASDELRSLTLAFSQLDEDLRRSWPVRNLRLQVPSISFRVGGEQAAATLDVLRETTGANDPAQLQRVSWRLRDGVLERGFSAWIVPSGESVAAAFGAGGTGAGPGVFGTAAGAGPGGGFGGEAGGGFGTPVEGLIWQPILRGVASLQMQGWLAGQGWVAAETLAGQLRGPGVAAPAVAGAAPAAIPEAQVQQVTGLLVRVVRTDGRVLQRVLPVKD